MKNSSTKDLSVAWQVCITLMINVVFVMLPSFAHAQVAPVDTNIGATLCLVVQWFLGNTGIGLATIAITVIGIGALLGKVSWGMAMIVGVGVSIIFGAAGIVNAMGTTASEGCTTTTSGGGSGCTLC